MQFLRLALITLILPLLSNSQTASPTPTVTVTVTVTVSPTPTTTLTPTTTVTASPTPTTTLTPTTTVTASPTPTTAPTPTTTVTASPTPTVPTTSAPASPTATFSGTVSYDALYGNARQSLDVVACSTGTNGLITRNYTTFASLPRFPYIGGAFAIAGYNSPACGSCWQLFYTASNTTRNVTILAIDVAVNSFNIALPAMNDLTNGQAVQLGRVPISAIQVPTAQCGL